MGYLVRAWRPVFLAICLESALFANQVPEALSPNRFRATAGESRTAAWRDRRVLLTSITSTRVAPSLEFPIRVEMISAKEPSGLQFVIPPATPPGEYAVEVTGLDADGRPVSTSIQVTVEPLILPYPAVPSRPPVILLNGWQRVCSSSASTLDASSETFGELASLLQGEGVPVAFFNNCSYYTNGTLTIEQLGSQLNIYLAGLLYPDGKPIDQVDLVVHSMGGLIVRAYLAGMQSNSSFSPPPNSRVRKLVQIATPNFGSFQAFNTGVQLSEMYPGSAFLWNLGRWNQGGDDLRGVDALAIIGNGGTYLNTANASDGLVSLTSASLGFAGRPDQRTRIVPYCHTTPPEFGMTCSGYEGIAKIADASHLTAQIVRSFLADTSTWQTVGTTPSQDPWLSQYGGIYFALFDAANQHLNLATTVSWGNVGLRGGGLSAKVFYNEFVKGTDTFSGTITSTGTTFSCGPFTEPPGYYTALRCKYPPQIFSVGPLFSNVTAKVVQSGTAITISGRGFGQNCPTCQVVAYKPTGIALSISSWTDSAVTAFLPSSYSGILQLVVQTSGGSDSINIMSAPVSVPPSISLSATQLQFSFTAGGSLPASQVVSITNSGGGTLTWSATSSASWLTLSSAPGTLTVAVNPTGLNSGSYNGTISITATGASNSPQTISVTLTVRPTSQISLSTNQLQFSYTIGGSVPASQAVTVTNAGAGGTLTWSATSSVSWLTLSSAPDKLTVSASPGGLNSGSYTGTISVTATGAPDAPQTILVTLTVKPSPPIQTSATWILPSSARSMGLGGSFYTTDLTVANEGSVDATVTLKFLEHDIDGRSGPTKTFTLSAGKSITYYDVLNFAFGLTSGFGAIRVTSSSGNLTVLGQTSTPGADGTFGQSVPATTSDELISPSKIRFINGVREDASFRTNLVLSNATESFIDVDVRLDSDSVNSIASRRYALPPLGMIQITKIVRDMGVATDLSVGRLQLSTPTTDGAFAAYASVIDNITNDPRTLLPKRATLGDPVWILPSSARAAGAGGAFYTTDLTISNTSDTNASFTLKFLGNNTDGRLGAETTLLLGGGKSVTYSDVLASVFDLVSGYGAIQITSSTKNLVIVGQTSTPGAGGTFGQSVPAMDSSDLIRFGSPQSIIGIREDQSFRTNLILCNATQVPVDVDVSLVNGDGVTLGSTKRYQLPPQGMTQITRVVNDVGITDGVTCQPGFAYDTNRRSCALLSAARLVISISTSGGSIAAYASVIDNATNDPRTLLPLRGSPLITNGSQP